MVNRIPQPGDVFGIWFGSMGRIARLGFIEKWDREWVVTVEGNTNAAGSREGDGLYCKRRLRAGVYAVASST